jgi:hypothetical protein
MTLDEVMKIDNVSERTRAFSRLPEHEQRKLFNPAERVMLEARDELYRRYLTSAMEANEKIGALLKDDRVAEIVMMMLRVHAANELRLELVGVPTPSFDSTFCNPNGPFRLFTREAVDRMKRTIREEIVEA